jgi:hypothetical protein
MCWQAPYALRLSTAHLKPTPAAVRFIRKHRGAARAGAANVRRRGERRRLQAALGCERPKPADGQRVENGFRKSLGTGCLLQQVFKLPHLHPSMPAQSEFDRIVPAMLHSCRTGGNSVNRRTHTAELIEDARENAA